MVCKIGRNFCFQTGRMNNGIQTHDSDNRRLIASLRQALDVGYDRLLEMASESWERNFAGKDPSDACVSIHISAGDSQGSSLATAGILRKPGRSLLNGHRHHLPA